MSAGTKGPRHLDQYGNRWALPGYNDGALHYLTLAALCIA